jgi:hypothetical protein
LTGDGRALPYASCPSAVVDAPVDIVWALLVAPAGWESVFDMRVVSVDPPGPAAGGQEVRGETGPEILHLKLTFRMMETDPDRYRLRFCVNLPFGLIVHEDMRCTPLDDTHCRVSYNCNFHFPPSWRGTLLRLLLKRRLDSGPEDSLSRLKRAAERRFEG